MRRVEQYLSPDTNRSSYRSCNPVWFQAWKYAEEDAILAALIEEIFKTMSDDDFFAKSKASIEKLMTSFKLNGAVANLVKGLTGGTVDPGTWFPTMDYKAKLGFYGVFQEFFDRLLWAYVTPSGFQTVSPTSQKAKFDDRKGALVIFIDDLDRCPNLRIVKVLETMKLFMDKPGCVFVLGADRDLIEKALEETYPKSAQQFMDKIVQVTFTLPPVPTTDIQQFLIDNAQNQQAMMKKFAPLVARELGYNIRAVKRFFNNMRLTESLVSNVKVDLTGHPHALMHWTIVEYAYPELATMIRGNVQSVPVVVEKIQALEEKESGGKWTFTKEVIESLRIPDSLVPWLQDRQVVELVKGLPTESGVLQSLISLSTATESSEEASEEEEVRRGPRVVQSGDKMVRVPKGSFLYGEDKRKKTIDYDFEIDIYPVTNQQFQDFIEDGGYDEKQKKHWTDDVWKWKKKEKVFQPRLWEGAKWNQPDHPVVGISWYEADAYAYAKWAGKPLPSDEEWEKAARGTEGRVYPWGDDFDSAKCNSQESGSDGTTSVTTYVHGLSPYGCYDMAGNVWEWTNSWYDEEKKVRVLRGELGC